MPGSFQHPYQVAVKTSYHGSTSNMHYYALATDYDGTLATDGRVGDQVIDALERLRSSGRVLMLVTGRQLDELSTVFSRLDLFARVVAENGALLYTPRSREEKVLGEPPSEEFVSLLKKRGVARISVGRSVVATWRPYETIVLDTIRDLGLELQVIFNKDAVMVLPSGVNKATGLETALDELGLSPHNVVGIGDAENDHAFLTYCHCAVAVANALPTLRQQADLVTSGDHGQGVIELINMILEDDLKRLEPRLARHKILLGYKEDQSEVRIEPHGQNILVAGTSGAGKSTLVTGLLERLEEQGYQFCVIDPEGDYSTFEKAIVLGDSHRPPSIAELMKVLHHPEQNVCANLIGIALEHRPAFFESLLPPLQELRTKTGRPHWLVLDETHHLLPSASDASALSLPYEPTGFVFITVHPEHVALPILSSASLIVAIGKLPERTIERVSQALEEPPPETPRVELAPGEGVLWPRAERLDPFWFRSEPPRTERRRHYRKYAEGELEPEKNFYFRGPDGKLELRAQNLIIFLQMADGVDDETWMYHLRRGDYSNWLRNALKDESLAADVEEVEKDRSVTPRESRTRIRVKIEERYSAPA